MSGIDREIVLDSRHTAKHLPGTSQVQRLLKRGGSAHVFNNEATIERVAQAVIDRGEFTGVVRGYERYGLFFAESIGYRINPEDDSRTPLFYGEVKLMQKIDTTSSPEHDPVKGGWSFAEVWIDPMLSPPYILLLIGNPAGSCRVHDPAENYKVVFSCATYDEAQTWLLEDEYEPVEGRLSASEL